MNIIFVISSAYLLILSSWCFLLTCGNRGLANKKFIRIYILGVAALSLLAFSFNPGDFPYTDQGYLDSIFDLSRYYMTIADYGIMSWDTIFARIINSSEPLGIIIFYILGKFNIANWLPVVSALTALWCLGLCFGKYIRDIGISSKVKGSNWLITGREICFSLLFFFAAISFLELINTVRNVIAFSLAVIGLVEIFVYERKKGYFILITASLIHVSVWVIFGFTIFYRIFPYMYRCRWIFIGWQLVASILSSELRHSTIAVVSTVGRKAYTYLVDHRAGGMLLYWLLLECTFIGIYWMVALIIKHKKNGRYVNLLKLLQILIIILMGGYRTTIAVRFFYILGFLCPLIVIPFFKEVKNRYKPVGIAALTVCFIGCIIYHFAVGSIYISLAEATFG